MYMPFKTAAEAGSVKIPAGQVILEGSLLIPVRAAGLVIFAHGSGSGRFSPRNMQVAGKLRDSGLATLLFDLLTVPEENEDLITGSIRFDINLLSRRLVEVTDWLKADNKTKSMALGYFGASTGAAAALSAAAQRQEIVRAVVSRGGRPDLAGPFLEKVKAPTLLIVGGEDYTVIDLNKKALEKLKSEKKLEIVPGATHLFDEPGTLEKVSQLASDWFVRYLT